MTDALRRILWLFPVLAAGAVVMFLIIGSTHSVRRQLHRPLFYNPSPQSAQVAAEYALMRLAAGHDDAAETLQELGGAALPVVLEALPTMKVKEQRQVSDALRPLTQRMKLTEKSSLDGRRLENGADHLAPNSDKDLLFWERYRDEHALDLRPLATSRLVRRITRRNAEEQSADLLAIDTYALPTLVSMLGRVRTPRDIDRCRRLVSTISHVTGENWSIPAGASLVETRKTVTKIRRFWDLEGGKWTQLDRFQLLVARFSQTEFASWVFRISRQVTGLDHADLMQRLTKRSRVSLPLTAFCLLGLLIIGPAVAATIQVFALRSSRWRLERLGLRAGLAAGVMTLMYLLLASTDASWGLLSVLCVLVGTLFSTFALQRELHDRLNWRTHHVLRNRPPLGRIGAVARWIAPSVPTLAPLAVAEAAVWVTTVEISSQTEGLGIETVRALSSGDLDFLMAMCLGLGLATGIAQVIADMGQGSSRVQEGEV